MKNRIIVEIIASLFILLFVYTAINKIYDFTNFKATLEKSPLIGTVSTELAIAIPLVEILIATLLFIPRTRLLGLNSFLFLMVLFTLYISYMVVFTPKLPCHCGGAIKELTWKQHILFNLFFIGLALTSLLINNKTAKAISIKNPHQLKKGLSI